MSRYEVYRMMSEFGPAAPIDGCDSKAEAQALAREARMMLKSAGYGRKVKVVVRDTTKRINPIDPFTTVAAAASLAWSMSVSKRLKELEGKRKNPTLLIATNPGKPVKIDANDPAFKAALKMYRKFHLNADPKEVIPVRVPKGTPKYLIGLGRAPEVTYLPDHGPKSYGPPFLHSFDDPPFLATDATGEYLGYVGMGRKYRITPEGIHG